METKQIDIDMTDVFADREAAKHRNADRTIFFTNTKRG